MFAKTATGADPQITAPEQTVKKAGSSVMDDAPLFAGLVDFVLEPKVRVDTEVRKKEEKKKAVTPQREKPVKPAQAQPQRAPKAPKAVSVDRDSMLFSVAEMCALLKISRATLVRMDKSGQLPGRIKLAGSVRYHRETVETWLKGLIVPSMPS